VIAMRPPIGERDWYPQSDRRSSSRRGQRFQSGQSRRMLLQARGRRGDLMMRCDLLQFPLFVIRAILSEPALWGVPHRFPGKAVPSRIGNLRDAAEMNRNHAGRSFGFQSVQFHHIVQVLKPILHPVSNNHSQTRNISLSEAIARGWSRGSRPHEDTSPRPTLCALEWDEGGCKAGMYRASWAELLAA